MAVALAVGAGEYEPAGEVLELLRRGRSVGTVTPIERARSR